MRVINYLPTGMVLVGLCLGASLDRDPDEEGRFSEYDSTGSNIIGQRMEKRLFHYPVYSSPVSTAIRKPCILPSGQILTPDVANSEAALDETTQSPVGNGDNQRDVFAVLSTRFQTLNGLNRLRLRPVRGLVDTKIKVFPRTFPRNTRAAKTPFPYLRALRSLRRCIRGA